VQLRRHPVTLIDATVPNYFAREVIRPQHKSVVGFKLTHRSGVLVSSGVPRRPAGAAGCTLARDAAAGFATVARAAPDMTAIQKRAGRPR
jgi:hypothetical protein